MLVVAIAAAMVDAIELRLPDPMTYPILAAGVLTMGVLEITGTHQGLVRGILGGVLYGGLLLGAGLLDPRSYALGDIKLSAGLGVWLGRVTRGRACTSVFSPPRSSCCSSAASSGRGTKNGAESSPPAQRWWPERSSGYSSADQRR